MSKLPEMCYGVLVTTNEIIIIKRGENCYHPTGWPAAKTLEAAEKWCDEKNEGIGVTRAQRKAMEMGSMWGWDVPAADPDNEINQKL